MKINLIILLSILVATNCLYSQDIDTEDESKAFSAECAFTPKYIWRGIEYTHGLAIQPFISFTQNQFSVQFWGNLPVKDTNSVSVKEFDIYVNYNYNLYGFVLTPSLFYYSYPGQNTNATAELSLAVSYSVGKFTLGSAFAKDIMEVSHAVYGYHDIKFATDLNEKLSLNLSAGIGWGSSKFNEYYIGVEKYALNYGLINGYLTYSVSDKFTVRPYFENYITIDQEIKDILGGNNFNFGIAVGVEL